MAEREIGALLARYRRWREMEAECSRHRLDARALIRLYATLYEAQHSWEAVGTALGVDPGTAKVYGNLAGCEDAILSLLDDGTVRLGDAAYLKGCGAAFLQTLIAKKRLDEISSTQMRRLATAEKQRIKRLKWLA